MVAPGVHNSQPGLVKTGSSKIKWIWKGVRNLPLPLTNQSLKGPLQSGFLESATVSDYMIASAFRSLTSR